MDMEDLKQSWSELREETRRQKIVTDELIRSVINDRVERLGRGFKVAGILITVGFICLSITISHHIGLFINDFGGGLDIVSRTALVAEGLIIAQYLLCVFAVARLYRAHRDISASDDLLRMSFALKRYNRLKRNLKPTIIIMQIILLAIVMNLLFDQQTASMIIIVTVPAVLVIYTIKNRSDSRDIREIEQRIEDLRRAEKRNNI